MDEKYQSIIALLGEERVEKNVLLANYTTFKIGGPADLFFVAETEEDLARAVGVARNESLSFLVLGGGSKLLVGDGGFRGLVIKVKNPDLEIAEEGEMRVTVGAGMVTGDLIEKLAQKGIAGLEFMAGIPGTVGGAVRGNAGAWQQSIGDKILRVKVLSPEGKISWLNEKECQFGYRTSRFKRGSGEIILAAEFGLSRGEPAEMRERMGEILEKRRQQPKEPSAGSVFINPKPKAAGEMIEACGLKGKQIGGAKISEKHANFIVNVGKAKASDVVALIELGKQKVKEKFNIDLKEEIVRVGEF